MKKVVLLVFVVLGIFAWMWCCLPKIQQLQTKHFEERVSPIEFLVVHSFALPVSEMIKRLDILGVSTHYMIDTEGHIYQLVPEEKVAWHAGQSFWRGKEKLNASSIGIELQNDTLGQSEFTKEQINAFVKLAKRLIKKYHIPPENIVAHSDIAPRRKVDVGRNFPWKEMAVLGIGLWPDESVINLASSDEVEPLLKKIGYDTTDIRAAALAFMRHFMPDLVKIDEDIDHMEENLSDWISSVQVDNPEFLLRLKQTASVY